MNTEQEILEQERQYLDHVIVYLKEEIKQGMAHVSTQKKNLIAIRKEMFAGGISAVDDLDRNIEISQYHSLERAETAQYERKLERLEKYKRVVDKPYFGRFDFKEEEEEVEKIYIGHHNIMRDEDYEMLVYDWRAPIASLYYRSELGATSYKAPCGEIAGEVSLKRQYEIEKGKLKYYFDSSLVITDDLLKETLSKHTSHYMKDIVETIQKEQDLAIRDQGNDLLIVQGVAGSGKTSIAMHRIAFLLYEKVEEGLTSNQIMIISPNSLFGEYVSTVLPELGEDNVCYHTLEDFFEDYFKGEIKLHSRTRQLEALLTHPHRKELREMVRYKGSMSFIKLLDALVEVYEKELITFKDVYFHRQLIASKESLRRDFLDNPIHMAVLRRLKRMTIGLEKKIQEAEKKERQALIRTAKNKGAVYEEIDIQQQLNEYKQKAYESIQAFANIDYLKLYRRLWQDKELFKRLNGNQELTPFLENVFYRSSREFDREYLNYEDGMALLYLKLILEEEHLYPQMKQVLIDEAQDYYPLQYQILKKIFPKVQYTVLGDIGQTIEKQETEEFYNQIIQCLEPKKSKCLHLNKSYRSSFEISQFAANLRNKTTDAMAYNRHDEAPLIASSENENQLLEWMKEQIQQYREEGFNNIAIICKTQKAVNHLYSKLSSKIEVRKLNEEEELQQQTLLHESPVRIMPVYMAKGLEYDAVIVYDVSKDTYHDKQDRQLLYIACTRALHRLSLCYTGELTMFLKEQTQEEIL